MPGLVGSPLRSRLFVRLVLVVLLAAGAAAALAAQPVAKRSANTPKNPGHGEVVSLNDGPAPAISAARVRDTEEALAHPDPNAARRGPKAKAPRVAGVSGSDDGISPGAPSDAEVRRMLRELQQGETGPAGQARLTSGGLARAPSNAPNEVRMAIAGGNSIADFPYVWGGGHGSFQDSGYDCSGSVSYALAAAGLLDRPLASGPLMSYGDPGPGRWITIYANAGHVFMFVAGLRFDTSGRNGPRGSRWQTGPRTLNGFVARHPPGL
jgi:cell wall-associated NlpC family hydrolase